MKITVTAEIFCKPESVFPWINDPGKAMRWQKGVAGGEIIRETPQRIGTTFTEQMEEDGKTLEMHGEITGFIPDRLIAFHLESRLHKVDVGYTVGAKKSGSSVTVDSSISWKFPMNLVCLFIGGRIKDKISRQTQSEMAELKRLCEETAG